MQGLFRNGREVRVTPKSLAVLLALARNQGRIVTKQELFNTVWAGTIVTEAALSSCIRELRRALEDDARNPHYIETVHRRGFRLLENGAELVPGQGHAITPWISQYDAETLPGRSAIILQLEDMAARVCDSGAELAMISGPSGIGKTTLLRNMAARILQREEWLVCEVSCTEPALAYGALLDVLEQLRQGPASTAVNSILGTRAVSWQAELQYRQTGAGKILPECGSGATSQWRARELCQALAAISSTSPLMICLDDIQLSDDATQEFILKFAQNPGKSRVLILASSDAEYPGQSAQYPGILRDLITNGRCTEFKLDTLDENSVAELLRTSVSEYGQDRCKRASEEIVRHTRGWPLLVDAELNRRTDVNPGGRALPGWNGINAREFTVESCLSELVDLLLNKLGETERRVLEAASVVGVRFETTSTAAAIGDNIDIVTDTLSHIAEKIPLISKLGTRILTDGSRTNGFSFVHEEYQAAVYKRLDGPRLADMHRRVGHWLETSRATQNGQITLRLARHFEQAGDLDDAVRHWYEAGAIARRRGAHGIALKNFRRAKRLLDGLARTPDRDLQAARICTALGRELVYTEGLGSSEAIGLYGQALDVSASIPANRALSQVLWRLWVFHLNRGPMDTARGIADRLIGLARNLDDSVLLVQAYHAQWGTSFMLGDLPAVLEHARAAIAVCGSGVDGSLTLTTGCTLHDAHLSDHNVAVCAGFFSAWVNAVTGRQESAARRMDEVISHARDINHPFTLALTLVFTAGALATCGNAGLSRLRAAEGRSIANRHGFTALSAWADIYEGWALVELGDTGEGMKMLRSGLMAVGQFGMMLLRPFHLVLAAEAQMRCKLFDDATNSIAEAFAVSERSGHRLALPEMHRLRGEITLRVAKDPESRRRAIRDLETAAEMADATSAHLWARRAKAALAAQKELVRVTSRQETG